MSIKKLHFSLLSFLIGFFVNAQIFPVQVNSNIVPPYLPSVSSYATSTNQKYFVNIFTADLSVVNRPATLKFYIEGNGIQAQSTPVVNGASPIYLNGGENISLTNIDLAPYFQIQNLQGISPAQYANNLPQGQYNYCIEVYDAVTNQKISQKSCTFYYFLYNEPPLLNLPANHDVQFFQDPQNLIFTWTPRHINATNIEYEFALVELIDNDAPSNYAFAVGAPLYQTTTNNTILLYGPSEPQMIAGRKYAWRVKAVNQSGFGEDALFNNNGYSEIYDFVYAGNCVAPTFVASFSLSSTQAKITWQPNPDHLGYKVEYRKLNTTNWFEAANFNNEAKLFDLEPSATYEFRVGAQCIGNQITYSPINQFTQPASNVVTLNCGLMPNVDLSNQVLYTATMPNDQVFLAGDFPIHVTEVSGTTTYTGKGWTNLPYFSFVRIEVEFKDIKVNTGMSLVDGVVKATYDPSWANIVDVNGIYDVLENAGDAFSPDTDEHSYQVNFTIPNASSIVVTDNSIVINGPAGQVITHDRDLGESVIIRDANGNVYGVGPTATSAVLLQTGAGFVPSSSNTTGVNSSGQVTTFDHTKAKVTFKRSANGTNASKFADDERPLDNTISSKILDKYKKINDYNYYYKGVENDGKATRSTEFIEARIETFDNTIVADSIVFNIKGSKATKVGNAVKNGNISTITLEVPVFETVKELELLALIKKTTATGKNTVVGATMIIPTKILPIVNVTIVPVNGATIPANINTSLQDIYKGVGVTFNTTVAPNYTSDITTLQCGDSGFMANYTAEQNTFIGKYTALHPADAKQYYVFVMNNITPSRPINGFMPLHRQIGFIFPSQTSQTATSEIKTGNDITTTIAHEMGHGIFELEHPWEDFDYPKTTPATNWLMDYAQGTKLPYTHWQKMSHPKFGLYVFQSDASGEYETDGHYSTVYLASLMLGLSNDRSKELATATEAPDTTIHSETKFELNDTWGHTDGSQQQIHSLTGGFHGIEEFFTAVKFLYTKSTNIDELGKLLHRFGDTYAHSAINNLKPKDLVESIDLKNADSITILNYIKAWSMQSESSLSSEVKPWIKFFNYYLKKYGFEFLDNETLQKTIFKGKTLKESLKDIYLKNKSSDFVMYGNPVYTADHAISDGGYPDQIWLRPDWYLFYVQNLSWLISEKFKLNLDKLDLNKFIQMVRFVETNKCSMKGIIDYEIAKRLNKKIFYIPVFSSNFRILASVDAGIISNYLQIAKDVVNNTKKYLIEQGISLDKIKVEEIDNWYRPKINTSGFFVTEAFKITIN